jgi:hypothetical protein
MSKRLQTTFAAESQEDNIAVEMMTTATITSVENLT